MKNLITFVAMFISVPAFAQTNLICESDDGSLILHGSEKFWM